MLNVLVTGGAGFVGAHLVNKLIEAGNNVTVVDTLKGVGGIPYLHPESDVLIDDITSKSVYKILEKRTYDVVFHLAAQSAGEPSYDDPKYDLLTNAYASSLIAQYCVTHDVKHLIYTSSVAVYGNTIEQELTEDSEINPDAFYGISKYAGEMYIKQLFRNENAKYTIFRLVNTYGPGENLNFAKKGMVSIYAAYIWKNLPIEVKGSIQRFRNFTYIDDARDMLFCAMLHEKSYNKTYNLSSGIKTTVGELIATMLEVSGKGSDYNVVQLEETLGDSFGFHASVEKLRQDFGWCPSITLDEGLRKYFEWIQTVPVVDDLSPYHPLITDQCPN